MIPAKYKTKKYRNVFKFGVEFNGELNQDNQALFYLNQPIWPDRMFRDLIPTMLKQDEYPPETLPTWKDYTGIPPADPTGIFDVMNDPITHKIYNVPFDAYWWRLLGVKIYQHHLEVGAINPAFAETVAAEKKKIADFVAAMKATYPTCKLVLMSFAKYRGESEWYVINDHDSDGQWDRIGTLLFNPKEYILNTIVT